MRGQEPELNKNHLAYSFWALGRVVQSLGSCMNQPCQICRPFICSKWKDSLRCQNDVIGDNFELTNERFCGGVVWHFDCFSLKTFMFWWITFFFSLHCQEIVTLNPCKVIWKKAVSVSSYTASDKEWELLIRQMKKKKNSFSLFLKECQAFLVIWGQARCQMEGANLNLFLFNFKYIKQTS